MNKWKREADYQGYLIHKLYDEYEVDLVLKNDSSYLQGIPDLLVLKGNHWAMLEVKLSPDAAHQPNQDFYIRKLGFVGFAEFINPENELEVLMRLDEYISYDPCEYCGWIPDEEY